MKYECLFLHLLQRAPYRPWFAFPPFLAEQEPQSGTVFGSGVVEVNINMFLQFGRTVESFNELCQVLT